jgi:hypothetical protein
VKREAGGIQNVRVHRRHMETVSASVWTAAFQYCLIAVFWGLTSCSLVDIYQPTKKNSNYLPKQCSVCFL